jgi:hypothetical protein
MIAHLQYFDAEPLGQSEQVVPGAFLEEFWMADRRFRRLGEVICIQMGWSALIFRNFAWGKPSLSETCETSLTIRRISDRVSISANSSAIDDARER